MCLFPEFGPYFFFDVVAVFVWLLLQQADAVNIPGLPGRYDWRHGDLGPSWERGLRCLGDVWRKIHQPNESMYDSYWKWGDFSDVMWIFMGGGVLHLASFEGRLQAVKIAFKEISSTCPKKMKPNLMGLFQTRCNKWKVLYCYPPQN